MKARAFALGLGGNVGDVRSALSRCSVSLEKDKRILSLKTAPLYRTSPWGNVGGSSFLNTAVCGFWLGEDRELLDLCRALELEEGSSVEKNSSPRLLDVDILFLEEAVSTPEMTVPHPEITKRRFVLVPLADIWRKEIPGLGRTPDDLLSSVEDDSSIIFEGSLH